MKSQRKFLHIAYAAALFLSLCRLSPASAAPIYPQATPRLPVSMSWAGTREIAAGALDAALLAVKSEGRTVDSLLWLYKLGVINAQLGNNVDAATALNAVHRGSPALAPLAFEQLGDMAVKGTDKAGALTHYGAALRASGLPTRCRQHIFAKIKPLADSGVALPSGAPWLTEYRQWELRLRLVNAAELEAVCDSLITAGLIAEADSLLEQHLPGVGRRDACRIVDRLFQKRPDNDTAMVGTRFLFTLASQAAACRQFALAERMLTQAQRRPNFSRAVPAKAAALLAAQIAYGREDWQRAIELYKSYETTHGAESEVLMNISRAYRALGNTQEMQRWQENHIRRFPSHQQTQEILWLRAWNLEAGGQFRQAAAAYRRLFDTNGRRTDEAHIRHALCYYKMKAHDSAIVHLEAFRRRAPQSSYLWAGLFWQGKNHAAMGRTAEAHRIWNEIARLDPTNYHAHRGMQLIAGGPAATHPAINVPTTGSHGAAIAAAAPSFAAMMPESMARAWLDSISPSSRKRLAAADSVALRRGGALLTVARTSDAAFFLDNFENNFSGNLLLQYDLATAYAIAGSNARAFRAARRLAWRIPMEHRHRMPMQVLAVMYPPYYSQTITKYGERFNVNPLFVSAVMRQESIFDAQIVSPAGAIGLMQVMPATGRTIAVELREPYTPDSLYSYQLNIRFGTYYLRKRLTQFNGDLVLALCSYNAGPGNAVRWRDRNRRAEFDVFVEDIGFLETRGYVKKVLGNYWTYQRLAATPGYDYVLPVVMEKYPWVNEW
jgi:soluble lytic murein transglycosylase-like protein/outer membrane protein assembly factor BamD (BamD/ComL family)